jgi:AraC family transcriptional regulator
MTTLETISLSFRNGSSSLDTHAALQFKGFSLEHSRVAPQAEYAFARSAQNHYLSFQDLIMHDGEMEVEGLSPVAGTDLRNKMSFVPANRALSGWTRTADRQNGFTILHFDGSLLTEETEGMLGHDDVQPLLYFENSALQSTMKKLEAVASGKMQCSLVYVETLALLAVFELGMLQGENPQALRPYLTGRLTRTQETMLRDYIEAHCTQEISLSDLARLAQLSRFYLARRFKATFGIAPYRYIMERRIDTAKRLLTETELPISSVAKATGFSTPTSFIRAFRNITGVTPLVYRRS